MAKYRFDKRHPRIDGSIMQMAIRALSILKFVSRSLLGLSLT